MDIRLINRETAESLISKAYRETKKFLKILNTSEDEMFKLFMDKKPALVKAAKDYIRFTNKFSPNEVDDVLEEFTVLSKNLIKAFDFYDICQARDWISDAFIWLWSASLMYRFLENKEYKDALQIYIIYQKIFLSLKKANIFYMLNRIFTMWMHTEVEY